MKNTFLKRTIGELILLLVVSIIILSNINKDSETNIYLIVVQIVLLIVTVIRITTNYKKYKIFANNR